MDAPLPFDVAEHLTTHRLAFHGGLVQLVLLVAPVGLVGALWCVRGQWGDAAIGRA